MNQLKRILTSYYGWIGLFLVPYLGIVFLNYVLCSTWLSGTGITIFLNLYRDIWVVLASLSYGAFRGHANHPEYKPNYAIFLQLTAWSPKKALPFGPVHFVWKDLVVLSVFMLLVWPSPYFYFTTPVYGMLVGYYFSLLPLFKTKALWGYFYLLSFGLCGSCLFIFVPWVSVPLLILLYPITYLGIQASLKKFHDKALADSVAGKMINRESFKSPFENQDSHKKLFGWPFDDLVARKPTFQLGNDEVTHLPRWHGVLIALLTGTIYFSASIPILQFAYSDSVPLNSEMPNFKIVNTIVLPPISALFTTFLSEAEKINPEQTTLLLGSPLIIFALIIGGLRIHYYCENRFPPISCWGRIKTFRWIIPEYDIVFLAPLCIFFQSIVAFIFLHQLGIYGIFGQPIGIALIVYTATSIGPEKVKWQLTAPCRVTKSPSKYDRRTVGPFEQI